MVIILLLACAGIAICLYDLYSEQQLKKYLKQQLKLKKEEYKPTADPAAEIDEFVSCSKALLSRYSKFYGMPTAFIGLVFYTALLIFALLQLNILVFIGAVTSIIVSLYLAYIQFVKIQTFCLICTSIYVVNILLLIFSYFAI